MDVEKLSQLEKEMIEFDYQDSWNHIFQRLKNEASLCCRDATVNVARSPNNRNRNRYRDISPFDHSRVKLNRGDNDYINASLVEMTSVQRKYILTQGPLPTTCGHFWQMVFEARSKAIVMLNRIVEKGVLKCHPYFPVGSRKPGGSDSIVYSDVGLKVVLRREEDLGYYIRRELEVEDTESGEQLAVTQWHYLTWPDFGVPHSPGSFLNFLMAVRRSGALEDDVGPPVIHCSAGVGRSGTFALVDTALRLIVDTGNIDAVDLRSLLIRMRRFRLGLIYTADQLRFSYLAVIEGARGLLKALEDGQVLDEVLFPVDEADLHPPPESTDDLSSSDDPDEEIVSGPDTLDEMYAGEMDEEEEVMIWNEAADDEEEEEEERGEGSEAATIRIRHSNNNAHDAAVTPAKEAAEEDVEFDTSTIIRAGNLTREERARRRADRMAKTQAIINEMKRKMDESDMRRRRWATFQRLTIPAGIVLAISVGGYFIYRVLLGGQGP